MKLAKYVSAALENTANKNCLTETDIEAAFGSRKHTSTSEPYYSEQVYQLYNNQDTIPIDENGQARVFTLIEEPITKPQEPVQLNVTQHQSLQHQDTASVVPLQKQTSSLTTGTQWL